MDGKANFTDFAADETMTVMDLTPELLIKLRELAEASQNAQRKYMEALKDSRA